MERLDQEDNNARDASPRKRQHVSLCHGCVQELEHADDLMGKSECSHEQLLAVAEEPWLPESACGA